MRRIAVVGTSGSGKTTVAHGIAQKFGISHIELDAFIGDQDGSKLLRPSSRQRCWRPLAVMIGLSVVTIVSPGRFYGVEWILLSG